MTIRLHNLPKRPEQKRKKRVGRGNASGKGTYSGRGIKGQRARSGGSKGLKKRSIMKQLIKKTPKLGGFKSLKSKCATITLTQLQNTFSPDETVNLLTLKEKMLISSKIRRAKIVATGSVTKKFIIENLPLSKQAENAIKSAGGEIK